MRQTGAQTLMPTMALAARFFWNSEASASWPTLYRPAALARYSGTGTSSRKAVQAMSTLRASPASHGRRLCWYPSHSCGQPQQIVSRVIKGA